MEIGLKACIARQFTAETIPDRRFVADVHSQDLRKLVGLAGLSRELREKETTEPAFAANWALSAAEWTPEARYQDVDQFSAQILIRAVKDAITAVLCRSMRRSASRVFRAEIADRLGTGHAKAFERRGLDRVIARK